VNATVKLRDLVIAQGASTNSAIVRDPFGPFSFAPIADFSLLRSMVEKQRHIDHGFRTVGPANIRKNQGQCAR